MRNRQAFSVLVSNVEPRSQRTDVMKYPPPPWKLEGTALLLLHTIDARVARSLVPAELKVVRVLPGKTLGGLYLASYERDSALRYKELIVFSALARYGRSFGFWVSHIYVDDSASVAGGRELWGLPKQLARFHWKEKGPELRVRVEEEGRVLCSVRSRRRLRLWHQPLLAPFLSLRNGGILHTMGRGTARLCYATGEAQVPPESPFSALQLGSSFLGVHLRDMRLVVPAPEPMGRIESAAS